MPLSPLYTPDNVKPAYELQYSLTIFWRESPGNEAWLHELSALTERDGIRILEHRYSDVTTSLFLVSTLPEVSPVQIPARIKGRLQHLLRNQLPRPFQRNYDLATVGATRGGKVENYVASQVHHHAADDPDLIRRFADLQITNADVDLLLPRFTSHARCTCNVHVVLVHRERQAVWDESIWAQIRSMIRRWAASKRCLLGKAGVLPDHLHLAVGFDPELSPLEVGLSLMNNLAWVRGMQPVFMDSCYLGTFGRYDLGAVRGY